MKKVISTLTVAAACACVWAQEPAKVSGDGEEKAVAVQPTARESAKAEKAAWPIWLAFNSSKDIDIVGMRFTLPYGVCESVTGFDLGVFGRCRYMEGFQLNLLRNEAEDILTGFQVGIYNTAGRADMLGVQIGLWNEASSIRGIQAGLINIANSVSGFQVGVINRSESLYGVQVGAVNVIREADPSFLPLVNVGFETFGSPAF
jgi:hypothetical protein